jgi:hypothetical protein
MTQITISNHNAGYEAMVAKRLVNRMFETTSNTKGQTGEHNNQQGSKKGSSNQNQPNGTADWVGHVGNSQPLKAKTSPPSHQQRQQSKATNHPSVSFGINRTQLALPHGSLSSKG